MASDFSHSWARRLIVRLAPLWLCLCAGSRLQALGEEIHFSSETDKYSLRYDAERLSGYDMHQIVWMSPWFRPDGVESYRMFSSEDARGVDKMFGVPDLEDGPREHLDELSFTLRAEKNLAEARREINAFESLRVPAVLEPVKSYLLGTMRFFTRRNEIRLEYLRAGRIGPLREALCRECSCGEKHARVIDDLRSAGDFKSREEVSRLEWGNSLMECYREKKGIYPMSAWNSFLKEFGMVEEHRNRSPE